MSDPIKVNIVVHTTPDPPRPWITDLLMACYQCGKEMLRGTQCKNCGAWCR